MSEYNNKKILSYNEEMSLPDRRTFSQRLRDVKRTRWIRFSVVSVLFFLFIIWLGNYWWLLIYPFLFDIYLTGYIRWTAWKHSKNPLYRGIMSWVDAIVYALILVYLIFTFIGQNYKIPSSSLEKTLLIGDYLWVNKVCYGPRVPITPIHFPLCQNTFPLINTKSYVESVQTDYRRLKGFRDVERYDIVVFNFPAGDTIAFNVQNPDYYTSCYLEGLSLNRPETMQQYSSYEFGKQCIEAGRNVVKANGEHYGEVMYRPVDRRENYVKRCIGLPGERLKIVNQTIYINGKPLEEPKNVQFDYDIYTDGNPIADEVWDKAGVSLTDRRGKAAGFDVNALLAQTPVIESVPLTYEAAAYLRTQPGVKQVVRSQVSEFFPLYPIVRYYGWTRADYAKNLSNNGIWIPKKGAKLRLTLFNLPIYERVIRNYEGNDLQVRDGKIYINGSQTDTYRFKMNYYWMMGDNRDNSLDSRYWGFVPEDHIVGTPMFVIVSFDEDKPLLSSIRWNRIFKDANPDK